MDKNKIKRVKELSKELEELNLELEQEMNNNYKELTQSSEYKDMKKFLKVYHTPSTTVSASINLYLHINLDNGIFRVEDWGLKTGTMEDLGKKFNKTNNVSVQFKNLKRKLNKKIKSLKFKNYHCDDCLSDIIDDLGYD